MLRLLVCLWTKKALNYIKRIASFKNPEFYAKQGMRLSTYNTPRIISCADVSEEYVACNQSILDTVDRLSEHCSEADIAHLKDIFRTCSRFEAFFWDMAWNMTL